MSTNTEKERGFMPNETKVSNNGIGFLGLLTIVLVILKCLNYFPYSWWLVFTPVLIGMGFVFLVLLIVFLGLIVQVWKE